MKANEFVKKFGWEYSRHILNEDSVILVDLDYTHLKRLVESYELVEKFSGLAEAKKNRKQSTSYLQYHAFKTSHSRRGELSMNLIEKLGGYEKAKNHRDYLIDFGNEFNRPNKYEVKKSIMPYSNTADNTIFLRLGIRWFQSTVHLLNIKVF